jgi:hypothetical protein
VSVGIPNPALRDDSFGAQLDPGSMSTLFGEELIGRASVHPLGSVSRGWRRESGRARATHGGGVKYQTKGAGGDDYRAEVDRNQ